jgi:predicted RNA-binding Zn-ribbon protein involved in translation (DUF1610 family)
MTTTETSHKIEVTLVQTCTGCGQAEGIINETGSHYCPTCAKEHVLFRHADKQLQDLIFGQVLPQWKKHHLGLGVSEQELDGIVKDLFKNWERS